MVLLALGQLLFRLCCSVSLAGAHPLTTPCPSLYSFHLCTPWRLFLPHAPILPISNTFSIHPGLLYSIQSCNHWHRPSTILSCLFSPDSLLLYLPKGSPGSLNPLLSQFCLSTYPWMLYLSLPHCDTHTNHSVSTRLTYPPPHKSVPPQSLSAWSTLGESNSLNISPQHHSLPSLPSLQHSHHHCIRWCSTVCKCVWNCKTDVTTGKDFSTTNELPAEFIQFNNTHTHTLTNTATHNDSHKHMACTQNEHTVKTCQKQGSQANMEKKKGEKWDEEQNRKQKRYRIYEKERPTSEINEGET